MKKAAEVTTLLPRVLHSSFCVLRSAFGFSSIIRNHRTHPPHTHPSPSPATPPRIYNPPPMSVVTAGEIADFVGGKFEGDRSMPIAGAGTLREAREDQLSFLANPRYATQLDTTKAGAILVANDQEGSSPRYIRVRNPYFAMANVVARWFAARPVPEGISPLASVAKSAQLGANVAIGAFAVIGENSILGSNVKIFPGVSIESESTIGDDTIIYANVSIYYGTRIGARCIIHSGAVIGADGYGFATEGGKHHKIPQIGNVRIGDDVEIGAGCCIDRGSLGDTVIGDGTKLDNLVQVGHNVKIGRHCLIVSQVAIAGSAELGDYVVVAGQCGIGGHLSIGDYAQVAAKASVFDDVPPKMKVMGTPAIPFRDFARREVLLKRLPELVRRVEALEKKSQ